MERIILFETDKYINNKDQQLSLKKPHDWGGVDQQMHKKKATGVSHSQISFRDKLLENK